MTVSQLTPDPEERRRAAAEKTIRAELGPAFMAALDDPTTTDIRVNGAGLIVVKQRGLYRAVGTVSPQSVLSAIYSIGDMVGAIINEKSPIYAGEFPLNGCRMQILLPPAVDNPVLVLRLPPRTAFSFDELVAQGTITRSRADFLVKTIAGGLSNIGVTGATGSGKTTFCNAILKEIGRYPRHLVLLEDEKELQPESDPVYIERLYAKKGFGRHPDVSMNDQLAVALRLDPQIISMGEVRQALAAIAYIEACNTGHRGGFVTFHADSATEAPHRLAWLVEEGGMKAIPHRIIRAIDVYVHLQEVEPGVRRVVDVAIATGHDGKDYTFDHVA